MTEPGFLTAAGGFCAPAEAFTVPSLGLRYSGGFTFDPSLYPPHRRVLGKTASKRQLRKRIKRQTSDLLAAYARIRQLTRETKMPDSQTPPLPTADQAAFEVYSANGGMYYRWRLRTADGEIVCTGQAHQTRDEARRECEAVKLAVVGAQVEDLVN